MTNEAGYSCCGVSGDEHDWRHAREKYGEDADGNRGIWVEYEYCATCKIRRDEQ